MANNTQLVGFGRFPIATDYLTALMNVATASGLDPKECMANSGLTPQVFFKSPYSVGNLSLRIVTANLLVRIPLEDLVCRFLDQVGMLNHGALSVAIPSSANLREALTNIALFADTRTAGKVMRLQETATHYRLELLAFAEPVEQNTMVDKFIILSTLMVAARGLSLLLRSDTKVGELHFDFTIDHPEIIQDASRVYEVHFRQQRNSLCFDKQIKFIPMITDRSVHRDAVRECEQLHRTVTHCNEVESRVRFELSRSDGVNLNIESVAAILCMSPRSLQRRLTAAGISFREIKAEELNRRATYLLENTSMTIESISRELGYAHPSNFIKCFKAQTRMSPVKYRESLSRLNNDAVQA